LKNSKYIIEFKTPDEIIDSTEYSQDWNRLALSSNNLYSFYQSQLWWQYSAKSALVDYVLQYKKENNPVIARIVDNKGELVGVVGLQKSAYRLTFKFKENVLVDLNIPVVQLMGGQPLIAENEELYSDFVDAVFCFFPCIKVIQVKWVPIGSYFWNIISSNSKFQHYAKTFIPNEESNRHFDIVLQESFSDYCKIFSNKELHDFRRQIRRLQEQGSGGLELIRIEIAEDVKKFLDASVLISSRSWQSSLGQQMDNTPEECDRYEWFANKGVLRCYLLYCGATPCAFVRGYQFGEVFYYSRTGYDQKYKKYAPGKVLLYLIIEDLHNYCSPKKLDFQEGDYDYKELFANNQIKKHDVFLVSKKNNYFMTLLFVMQKVFRNMIFLVKKTFQS
jgi:hypothetical protein